MIKNSIVALVAAAALVGVAAPAFASTTAFGDGSPEMRQFIADSVVTELNRRGINATSVEDWSGLVRAFVTLDDGTQVMQLFTPNSLQPVVL